MTTKQPYPEEFKIEAVKQITERGHRVADVSARIGVSQHSLYKWIKAHAGPVSASQSQAAPTEELRRLKAEIKRVTVERDILKNGHRTRCTAPLKRNTCRPKLRTVRLAVVDSFLEASNPVKKPGPGEAADPAVVAPSCDPV